MATHKTPLVVGNWKMHPATLGDAKQLFVAVRSAVRTLTDVSVVVAPPFPFLAEAAKLSPSGRVAIAAQDTFYEALGARTGEVSPQMLASVGVSHVIIGHSERRALGETDADVAKKVQAVLNAKLIPILCVGEAARDKGGQFFSVVEDQLTAALASVPPSRLKDIIVAYEPVWAIGTGAHATPADVEEMRLFIMKVLTKHFGRARAGKVPVLYGGSVKPDNAVALFTEGVVDGFLVGGASLKADEFTKIIKATLPR